MPMTSSRLRAPVTVDQDRVGEDAHDRVGVRGPDELVDDGRAGVGQPQLCESRSDRKAWVGWAEGSSHEVVVAVVVVVGDSPTEGVVSCSRVVVGAVGTFCGEPAFEGFTHRFSQERPSNSVRRCDRVRIESGDPWRRPVARGEEAELLVGEASLNHSVWTSGIRTHGEESASGASEGLGGECVSQGRGCGKRRHCLSFQSTTFQLPYKCEVL